MTTQEKELFLVSGFKDNQRIHSAVVEDYLVAEKAMINYVKYFSCDYADIFSDDGNVVDFYPYTR